MPDLPQHTFIMRLLSIFTAIQSNLAPSDMAYCNRCNRSFKNDQALQQHRDASSCHHLCYPCNKDFASRSALVQHLEKSSRHHYCSWCDEDFDDSDELDDHYTEEHAKCSACDLIYLSDDILHEHCLDEHEDEYCAPCQRLFRNNNALWHHERSTFHQGRTVRCPMKGCAKSFVSRAALVNHLESGGCRSGIDRALVNRIVAKLDTHGVISNPRLLGDGFEGTSIRWRATSRAWNGTHFECYLCHRTFTELERLNQHLGSAAHEQKGQYRCPAAWKGCGVGFKALSGLCQHVESEQCGVCRFKRTMDKFIDGLSGGRLLV